jgi:hypothetical protein
MTAYENLQIGEGYARYSPQAHVTWEACSEMVTNVAAFCRDQGVKRLLIDARGLVGFRPPDTIDRYFISRQLALESAGHIKIAVLTTPDLVDAERYGIKVAQMRGLAGELFTSEPEALEWLVR